MALKAALVITAISIALLTIYGADVAYSAGKETGFLPFDNKVRGYTLGGPAMALPIIAYFISKKEPSKILAGMLFVTGIMILVGGAAFFLNVPEEKMQRNPIFDAAPLFIVGAFQIALGAIKVRKSK